MKTTLSGFCALFLLATLSGNGQTIQRSDAANLIEISIETSRPQPTAGTGLGVIADIKNVSGTNIYLKAETLELVFPPELEAITNVSFGIQGKYAFFVTEWSSNTNDSWDTSIVIKPGATYRTFWAPAPDTLKGSLNFAKKIWYVFLSEMSFTFFSPGDYKISVVAKYWIDPSFPPDDYRTFVQSAVIHVSAPQFVILTGAAIGGLIAYFILPQARRRLVTQRKSSESVFWSVFSRITVEVAGILGSVLLSAIITILLSRISETQFLIRVTVNDFWGAIAVGFVANYGGTKLLAKILHDENTDAKDGRPGDAPVKPTGP